MKALQAELQRLQAAHAQLGESSRAEAARLEAQLQEANAVATGLAEEAIERLGRVVVADGRAAELEQQLEKAKDAAKQSDDIASSAGAHRDELLDILHQTEARLEESRAMTQRAVDEREWEERARADAEETARRADAARDVAGAEARKLRDELAFAQRVARSAAQAAAARLRETADALAAAESGLLSARLALAAEAARADAAEAAVEQLHAGFQRRLNEALVQQNVSCPSESCSMSDIGLLL